jgi:cell division protein FtsZ
MIDEKIEDECWVTVVATGYGDQPVRRSTSRQLQEPVGEPRVRRNRPAEAAFDLEVPEFIPGG